MAATEKGVLAVMGAAARLLRGSDTDAAAAGVAEARAHVAELIEASRDLLKSGSDAKRNRLRAALVACGVRP
jgi:hypothetical protein